MNFKKITAVVIIAAFLASSLFANSVSALSEATISLSGATNQNGNFSVVVYGNTNTDTVTIASVALDFSPQVNIVSYDYSVGPFKGQTPSGAHYSTGAVAGTQAIARVTFTVANPSTVTATVSSSSFLKHAESTGATENFAINRGSATFTYSAPQQNNTPSPTVPPTSTTSSTANNEGKSTRPSTSVSGISTDAVTSEQGTTSNNETPAEKNTSEVMGAKDTTKLTSESQADTAKASTGIVWKALLIVTAIVALATYFFVKSRTLSTSSVPARATSSTIKGNTASPTKNTKKVLR